MSVHRGTVEGLDPPTRAAIKGFDSDRIGRDELVTSWNESRNYERIE